jgi:nitroreductase
MANNVIIDAMLNRKSIRKYKKRMPSDKVIKTIVRAAQQAPFAAQLYSFLLTKDFKKNPFGAPLQFVICVDMHKLELIMARKKWKTVCNDLTFLIFGMQDASLAAENMVMAAESFGLGSCFLGDAPYRADQIAKKYNLPKRVFPLIRLVIGYPDENPPPRPRYPLEYSLFENEYPKFTDQQIDRAMSVMDNGYMGQEYYRKAKLMIELVGDREETFTFDTYGWTEHISRKWGQWFESEREILDQLEKRGFKIGSK